MRSRPHVPTLVLSVAGALLSACGSLVVPLADPPAQQWETPRGVVPLDTGAGAASGQDVDRNPYVVRPGQERAERDEDRGPRTKSSSSFVLTLGSRGIDEPELFPGIDSKLAIGSEFAWTAPGSVFGFEIGLTISVADGEFLNGLSQVVEETSGIFEFYFGPRLDFELGSSRFHLVLGAGPSFVTVTDERTVTGLRVESDDDSLGLYGHAGLFYDASEEIQLGLDLRVLGGTEFELYQDIFAPPLEGSADSSQLALAVAIRF
ncbi:MAG: hypothetical protein R3F30_07645 [Planctomycetota bacterium]